jgi:hypothetical protein
LIKKLFIWLVSVLGIYLLSFIIFGKDSLVKQLALDNKSTYNTFRWTNNIYIASNLSFKEHHKEQLQKIIKSDSVDIEFLFAGEEFLSTKRKPDTYYYVLDFITYSPLVKIDEVENIEEYVAAWRKEYVWCFYKWIRIKEEMTGIS